jgi:hypothetical protein
MRNKKLFMKLEINKHVSRKNRTKVIIYNYQKLKNILVKQGNCLI